MATFVLAECSPLTSCPRPQPYPLLNEKRNLVNSRELLELHPTANLTRLVTTDIQYILGSILLTNEAR